MSVCCNAIGIDDGVDVKAKETTQPVIFVLLEQATSVVCKCFDLKLAHTCRYDLII